jgi:hypothetical protein
MDIGYGCSMLPFVLTELFPYGITAWAGYLGLRVVRAAERRGLPPAERAEALADRVRRLEEMLEDTLEAQRFTTRLLLHGAADREVPLATPRWPASRPAADFDPGESA